MSNGVSPRPLTVTEQAIYALSGAPDTYKVTRNGDIGRCEHCNHFIGTITGKLLHAGHIIMYHRNRFRCGTCNANLIWEPKDY